MTPGCHTPSTASTSGRTSRLPRGGARVPVADRPHEATAPSCSQLGEFQARGLQPLRLGRQAPPRCPKGPLVRPRARSHRRPRPLRLTPHPHPQVVVVRSAHLRQWRQPARVLINERLRAIQCAAFVVRRRPWLHLRLRRRAVVYSLPSLALYTSILRWLACAGCPFMRGPGSARQNPWGTTFPLPTGGAYCETVL